MRDDRLLAACLEELRAIRALLEGNTRPAPPRAKRVPLGVADASGPPSCPNCQRPMKKRHRHRDGAPFWGCSSFPECTGIVNIEDEDEEPFTPHPIQSSSPSDDDWTADEYERVYDFFHD